MILSGCLLVLFAGAISACSSSSSEGPTLILDGAGWDVWPGDHLGGDGALPDGYSKGDGAGPDGADPDSWPDASLDSAPDVDLDLPPEVVECKEAGDCEDLHGPPPICQAHLCEAGGCDLVPVADGTLCNDGDQCSHPDECVAGACVSGDKICDCATVADCDPYQDEDVCNGEYDCIDGSCQIVPDSVVECEDNPDDCILVTCQPATGECLEESLPDDDGCDDGDLCTLDDHCQEGECLSEPVVCDDDDLCTEDACEADSGECVFVAVACDDGDECTIEQCDPAIGECVSTPLCDDGDLCTVDSCQLTDEGPECSHVPADIGDGDLCTVDSCDPTTGEVSFEPVDCDDGLKCTNDFCDPVDGACYWTAVECEDGDACTVDACSVDSGECAHEAADCDDGDACTDDSCNAATGCQNQPILFDDVNGCTYYLCDHAAVCLKPWNESACDDDLGCTKDDQCVEGECQGVPLDCEDDNVCTEDVCAEGMGCIYLYPELPCEDGDACTGGDMCSNGLCEPGGPVDCDDGNPCSLDSCDPATGCINEPGGGACDDGNLCTEDDWCAGGKCLGSIVNCDDGNGCTADSCAPGSGCLNEPLSGVSCQDGEVCTVGDECAAGECVSGPEVCVACEGKESGEGCDDGQASTAGDLCVEGKCLGWTLAQYDAPGLPEMTAFVDVDHASGSFLAVGHSSGGDGAPVTAWAVTLEAGEVAKYHVDSERTDVVFTRVSNNLAAGVAQGTLKASFFDGAAWEQDQILEETLEGLTPHFGTLGDMWGARLKHKAVAGKDEDLYLLAGRSFGNAKAVARHCTRTSSGGAITWDCPKMAIAEYEAFEHPRGVWGVVAPPAPCADSESCTMAFQQAFMVANGSSGAQATPYLDWYEAAGLDVWSWNVGSPSDLWDTSDWTAIAGSGADEVWAVGTGGLLSRHDWAQPEGGDPQIVGLPIAGADELQFRAVVLSDGFLFAAGERDEEFQQNGQAFVKRTLFVVAHDLAEPVGIDSSWSYHALHEATAPCGADCATTAVELGEISGAAASGGQVYLVGSAGTGPAATKGGVFFLQM